MNRTLPHLARANSARGGHDLPGFDEIEITGITADSRAVQPGFLFAALPGGKVSGVDFIPEAAKRGAAGHEGQDRTSGDRGSAAAQAVRPNGRRLLWRAA